MLSDHDDFGICLQIPPEQTNVSKCVLWHMCNIMSNEHVSWTWLNEHDWMNMTHLRNARNRVEKNLIQSATRVLIGWSWSHGGRWLADPIFYCSLIGCWKKLKIHVVPPVDFFSPVKLSERDLIIANVLLERDMKLKMNTGGSAGTTRTSEHDILSNTHCHGDSRSTSCTTARTQMVKLSTGLTVGTGELLEDTASSIRFFSTWFMTFSVRHAHVYVIVT